MNVLVLAIIIVVIVASLFIGLHLYKKNIKEKEAEIATEVIAQKEELDNILPYGMDGKELGVVKGKKFTGNGKVQVDIKKSTDGKIQGIHIDGHDMTDQILFNPYRIVNIELGGGKEGFSQAEFQNSIHKMSGQCNKTKIVTPIKKNQAEMGDKMAAGQTRDESKLLDNMIKDVSQSAKRGTRGWLRAMMGRLAAQATNPCQRVSEFAENSATAMDATIGKIDDEGSGAFKKVNESTRINFQNIFEGFLEPNYIVVKNNRILKSEKKKIKNKYKKKQEAQAVVRNARDPLRSHQNFENAYPLRKKNRGLARIVGKEIAGNLKRAKRRARRGRFLFRKWQNDCRKTNEAARQADVQNGVEQTSSGGKMFQDKCGFQNMKNWFFDLFSPRREGFGGDDCDLSGVTLQSFHFITNEGFKIVTSGFSHKKDYVGSSDTTGAPRIEGCGFYCDGTDGCSTKMKTVISRLEKGRNYKIAIWGWENAPPGNSGQIVNHEPVQFDILANGNKFNEEPLKHIASKLPKDPAANYKGRLIQPLVVGVATAMEDTAPDGDVRPNNGWGKIEITWSVLDDSYCIYNTNCKGPNKDMEKHGHIPYSNIQITEMEMANN